MSGWRFFATRLNGDGTETALIDELPLADSQIVNVLTGTDTIAGKITPELATTRVGGELALVEWATAIYAELDGVIQAGCILQTIEKGKADLSLDSAGFVSYATGMPYNGEDFYVRTDALDIFRVIWGHLQSYPKGNIGLQLDQTKSGVLLGDDLEQVDFETSEGEAVSFEAGPVKLAWWLVDDLGKVLVDLATEANFDWKERHAWLEDGEGIAHHLHFGVPRLGRRRTDLTFVEGENVLSLPNLTQAGEEYASEVWALGAGEGREMRRGNATRPGETRLRRVAVVADKSARSHVAAAAVAQQELSWRNADPEMKQIALRDWDGSLPELGDEIRIQGNGEGYTGDAEVWERVLSMTRSGSSSDVVLSTARADKMAS